MFPTKGTAALRDAVTRPKNGVTAVFETSEIAPSGVTGNATDC